MGLEQRPISKYMSSILFALILCFTSSVRSQSASTSTPVPPLQWINITGLLGGSNAPPPLKDVSLGYDDISRNLLIFGGESQQGFPQSQTYLLNLDTLTWHPPAPPLTLQGGPPARSAAISGDDVAASNRHSHIVIGGKGTNNQPLSDIWEFDYISQFWSQVHLTPGGPSPRWGAVGGIDVRTPPVQDISLPGPNNTFYLAGGFDGTKSVSVSDLWRLNISGILSSNNPDTVVGSWEKLSISEALPGKTGLSGTVVFQGSQQHVVALGGCTTSLPANASCVNGDEYIINVDARNDNAPPICPAPRLQPAVAANFNGGSSSFRSQVFMLLGTVNSSLWNDGGGLRQGEVAVLDTNAGGWARVLPSGDPGTNTGGTPAFPSPRAGAAALSWNEALVGTSRALSSDTIVFGGEDQSGNYLSEIWILRAYNDTLTQSNAHWSGFGDGQLRGGANADGQGVTIRYLSSCASAISQPTSSGSSAGPSPTGPSDPTNDGPESSNPSPSGAQTNMFDTSVVHKTLAPVSIAILLPAILFFRLSSPSVNAPSEHRVVIYYLSILVAFAAFGVGIGGLASSFTSIISTTPPAKRSSSSINLTTNHGKAGLALFVGLFGVVPFLLLASACGHRTSRKSIASTANGRYRVNSGELAEKVGLYPGRVASPQPSPNGVPEETAPEEPRQRARSWNTLSPWPGGRNAGGRRSSESGIDAASSPSTVRSFEVTNRPTRARHASAHSLAAFADPRPSANTRNLSNMNWLERRRSLNTVGDLDYALAQLPRRGDMPPTPGTAAMDIPSTRGLVDHIPPHIQYSRMPSLLESLIHFLLHAFLLGLCIVTLVALWSRAPKAAFGVFLAWVVGFYIIIIFLASRGVPQESVLSVVINRLKSDPSPAPPTPTPSRPLSDIGLDSVPFPSGPYTHHQPPFRVAHEADYFTSTQGGHGSSEDGDDIDEETRQRNIEEEMSRRDVSIVTVPKRKLFLTNPEVR